VKDSVSNKVEGSIPDGAATKDHRATKKQKNNLAIGKAKEFSSKEKPEGSQWKSKNYQDGKNPDSGRSPKGQQGSQCCPNLKIFRRSRCTTKKEEAAKSEGRERFEEKNKAKKEYRS